MSSKFSGGWNGFTIEPLAENTDDVGNVAGDDDTATDSSALADAASPPSSILTNPVVISRWQWKNKLCHRHKSDRRFRTQTGKWTFNVDGSGRVKGRKVAHPRKEDVGAATEMIGNTPSRVELALVGKETATCQSDVTGHRQLARSGRGAGQCQQKKVPLARNVVEGAKCQPNGTGHCRIGVATCQPNGTGCCWYTLKARDKTEVIEPQVIRRNNRKERMKSPISKSQLSPLPQSNDV